MAKNAKKIYLHEMDTPTHNIEQVLMFSTYQVVFVSFKPLLTLTSTWIYF